MPALEKNERTSDMKIDIPDILRDLYKDLWLMLIIGLSAAMLSMIAVKILHRPAYTSSATFVVTSKGMNNTYINLAAANSVATSLTNVFDSDILRKKVAADLGIITVPDYIRVEVVPETNLFVLSVSAPDPYIAYRIITSIMENYTSVTSHVFENALLDVIEYPKIPLKQDNPLQAARIMKTGFLLGTAAMGMLLIILSALRDNIKNEKDVARKLDTKLFGVVNHEKTYKPFRSGFHRNQKSIVITNPTVSFHFTEAIKKIRTKFEYKALQKGHNVLLITSVMAGEGKSTIAANLALALVQKSKNVLLIDADFSKPSVYKILQRNIEQAQELGECIIQKSDIKDALIFDDASGLYLLIGSRLYKNSTDLIVQETFQKLIKVSKKIMDYIIIDAPPITFSADTEILADTADVSLLVVKQSTAAAKDINEAVDILNSSNSRLLGCIYNNVHNPVFGHKFRFGHKYSYKYYETGTGVHD